jgi:hypothetical protein
MKRIGVLLFLGLALSFSVPAGALPPWCQDVCPGYTKGCTCSWGVIKTCSTCFGGPAESQTLAVEPLCALDGQEAELTAPGQVALDVGTETETKTLSL